jgi:hypothetical protein
VVQTSDKTGSVFPNVVVPIQNLSTYGRPWVDRLVGARWLNGAPICISFDVFAIDVGTRKEDATVSFYDHGYMTPNYP